MTTCPRCGRVAGDEFVCAACGAFLAGGTDVGPADAVSIGRVAVLVLIVCLLGVGGAAFLLLGDGGRHQGDLSAPLSSGSVALSKAPIGGLGDSTATSRAANRRPTSSAPSASSASSASSAAKSPKPSSSAAPSARRSRSAPGSRKPSTPQARSTSRTPHSSSKPPPPRPTVRLAKGGAASCGPHCYSLVVSLTGLGGGTHDVTCFSDHTGQFGHYPTSADTSTGCSYRHPHDTVWVVVDGTRSNSVAW